MFFVWVSWLVFCVSWSQKLGLKGLIAAVYSPFDSNGDLDLTQVELQAEWLNITGVYYAYIGGTTGESVSMTVNERQDLLSEWVKIAPKYGINIIAHVGCNSLEDSVTLALQAKSLGVLAIASMPPNFFKPSSVSSLVLTINYIASTVPDIPFYYYHIPSMTNVDFSMYDFVSSADGIINNLAGIKYTGLYNYPGFMDVMAVQNYKNGKYEVLTGRDELLCQCLSTNIVGFVGSQYNFAGQLYNKIISDYNNGNINNCLNDLYQAQLLLNVQSNVTSGVNGGKYMMNLAGNSLNNTFNIGDARLPFTPITNNDQTNILIGTKQWCSNNNNLLSWCSTL